MGDQFTPTKDEKFTFGLWTVGNRGRDPFGEAVRDTISPIRSLEKLSKLGAWGVNLHDNDLVPFGASLQERNRIVKEFKKALDDTGMVVPMATTNLFYHPVFKDGAFTSNDKRVRHYALQKTMQAMDLGAEIGAEIYVFWGGREGTEVDASKDAREAIKRMREAMNFLCHYNIDMGYGYKFALEAKPNEPRSDIYFPTTGHMLAFIETLDHADMVGVNPEVAHEQMSGLNFYHVVAQAIEAGKLFHIDLNDQKPGRYDQDLRFSSESIKSMFYLVKLLEESGYNGPRHFDAHAYRSEDEEGVWAFAHGCMRSYMILKDKARRFEEDPEIQGILKELKSLGSDSPFDTANYNSATAEALKAASFDIDNIAKLGLMYEQLDQLVIDLLLGIR
ncbi:MAG: xylose isomerase [Chloroflexi bacterium]|uniref:Xylose isomerase n=1 Tax=Candidatus Chlorohelix allophototropha TaxID=3003348 RepID=A0A8T7LZN2_9CHLR|nr:xylose isomerase [Chloroflexota bacterium]WJW66342.1 xylose isomerase [Chloroflexota bacterium L227-S17]